MSQQSKFLPPMKRIGVAALASAAVLLSGCALTSSPVSTTIQSVTGKVHGGQTPIQGSTVTLYVTNAAATGYGQAATTIGSGTTDGGGGFSISPSANSANCPAGSQAYITAAGGYPSGSPTLVNNSDLMMAALGDCGNISASTFVIMNEVTTVAAAYALSGFMKTSAAASGSLYVANVSAPAANNAASGSGSTTAAAGLAHAFLNAATLANYAGGTANATTANITSGAVSLTGTIPQAEINTLGNILQACVDSATGSTPCTSLFGFTPSITGVAPVNTLQSMINLARNPYPSTAAMSSTSGLLSLTPGTPAFQPALSSPPPDWAMAITYTAGTKAGAAAALPTPYDIALGVDDTLYYGNSAAANLTALSAYGVATPTYTAGTVGSATRQIAPDALGNVWVTTNSTSLYQYSAKSGGAPATSSPTGFTDAFGVAIDSNNNVWVADAVLTSSTVTSNIKEYAYTAATGTTASSYAVNYTAAFPTYEPVELTIDASQNIWAAAYYTGGTLAGVLPNLSAATATATPTYAASGTTVTPVTATFASSATKPLGVVIDASGNAWYGITGSNSTTTTGIEEVIPVKTSSVITSLTPQSLITGAALGAKASQIPGIDGAGSIYLPDNQGSGALGIHVYSTVTATSSDTGGQVLSPPSGYLGCTVVATAATGTTPATTTCSTTGAVYNPREIAIDSTGSVWAGYTSGGVTQVIGLGAPTWPLLQEGKPGVAPGSTTALPLP